MLRYGLLVACYCTLFLGNIVIAMEPVSTSAETVRALQEQRSHARQLIQQRAAKESQERSARIAARKRAGISLQRPFRTASW